MKTNCYAISLIVLFIGALPDVLHAEVKAPPLVIQSNIVQKSDLQNALATKQKEKLNFTLESLDVMWSKRQEESTQQEILKFVKNEPSIPADFEMSWKIARLVYFIGHFGVGKTLSANEKVEIFKYGYRAGEVAKQIEPKKVEGHYWFAIDLGAYGLAKGVFSALSNASKGRDSLLEAAKIDPSYHWGGPYRVLGRYYQELPSFISFGDKKIAEDYFKKAIEIAPEYKVNKIYLGVLYGEQGKKTEALNLFHNAETMSDIDGKYEEIHYKIILAEDIKKLDD